jgi:hypothetical protein
MSGWTDLLLLLLAAGLWWRGCRDRDEVFSLLVRFLAIVVLLVVLIAGRSFGLELALLALALWLPSAMRFESDGRR